VPIKGLTDRVEAAFPRIGKLRKGAAAPRNQAGQVVGVGKDQEFFRFTSERPEVIAAFEEAYGAQPALVSVYLPYADVERNFACWKEKWTAGGLVHRCDGETMTVWLDTAGKYQRTPRHCDGGCDEVGRLTVIIPELVRAGFVGYVVLETHGINDVLSIQASLMAAWETRAGNPLGLRGIQWALRRVKEKISTPMPNGKRARRDKWLVKLEPAADWVQLQLQAAHNATMMLPAGQPAPETATAPPEDFDPGDVDDRAVDADGVIVQAKPAPPDLAPEPAPNGTAEPEQGSLTRCADCGEPILGHQGKAGRMFEAQEIIDSTKEAYQRALCWNCAQDAKAKAVAGTPA
jgi:hypothetical protein